MQKIERNVCLAKESLKIVEKTDHMVSKMITLETGERKNRNKEN